MAKLILHSEGPSKEYTVEDELTIGRHKSCSIFLDEPKASRKHASIHRRGSYYEIQDLGSSNGTKINGHKVKSHYLEHGDTIQIGRTRLSFDAPEIASLPKKKSQKEKPAKATRSTNDPLVGTTLGGHKITAKIGQGGMGTVYEALQISLDRNVAIKVLNPELARDRGFAKEFLHEARSAGRFQHPGLVEIHDVNETKGILYYSMELIDGESAMEKLKRKGKLELANALDIAIGVAEVLVHLEKEDAVHQDIKPHNILLLRDGKIKLTDFGLATVGGRIRRIAANPDSILGTPYYMSPEQASRTKRVTAKADLYGLGCTLYHLLVGKVPFEGNSALVVLAKHANQTRPDAHEANDDVPEALSNLIKEMMAIEPDERPSGPKDVLDTLKRIRTGLSRTAGVPPVQSIRPRPSAAANKRSGMASRPVEPVQGLDPMAGRLIQVGVIAVMLVLGFQIACLAVSNIDPNAGKVAVVPKPPPVDPDDPKPDPNKIPELPPKIKKVETAGQKKPDATKQEQDETEKAFQAALQKRDRAMAQGNFSGARLAIVEFRQAYTDGESARRAHQAYQETQDEIVAICDLIYKEAEAAAAKKDYRLATAKCTRLMSAEPRSAAADNARALMGRVDRKTQPRFDQAREDCRKQLLAGKLKEALTVVSTALDELGGTKWAEPLLAEQLNIIMARQFLKDMEAARQALADKARPVSIQIPDLSGKKRSGILRKVRDLALTTELKGITMDYSFGKMTANEIRLLVAALGMEKDHLLLWNLFTILDKKQEAQQEMAAARKVPEQAAEIDRLILMQAGVTNQHRYDFSKWEHQSDWEAPSGAWSTQNDQYLLESVDGGDTFLKTEAINGPFPARNARIGFEIEPRKRNEGYYISAEFGDERNNITLLFTSTGWELQFAVAERTKTRGSWSNGRTKVEIAIDDKDRLVLTLNGKAESPVKVRGLSKLKGTISFHAREAACAFDNVYLRTVQ